MGEPFSHFGGIDFSGAREPLANLWSAVGIEENGRLKVLSVRPHAFRKDLATYVVGGWRSRNGSGERILWGADFPFGLPHPVGAALGAGTDWRSILAWVADRPADEVRLAAGDAVRSLRGTDSGGALAPLDLRLYKQTIEGFRWLQQLLEEDDVCVYPQAISAAAPVTLIEVYPSSTVKELGMPRRRTPSRPGEVRARAAALRTFMDFATPDCEYLVVTLEDAWDAAIACLTAYLCRDDLAQPFRAEGLSRATIDYEGWIYRPPATLG
jgi:hypothetical protein